jgi:hypothetical protein
MRTAACLSLAVLLGTIAGLRGPEASTDYESYQRVYEQASEISSFESYRDTEIREELLYLLVNIVVAMAGGTFTAVLLCVALAATSIKLTAFDAYRCHLGCAVAIYVGHYYLMMEWNQIRAGIASGVLYWALYQWVSGRRGMGLALWGCAILFHSSAFAFAAALLVVGSNLVHLAGRMKPALGLLAVASAFGLVGFGHLLSALIESFGLGDYPVFSTLVLYSGWDEYNASLGIFNITTIKSVLVFIFCHWLSSRKVQGADEGDRLFSAVRAVYLLGILWRIVFSDFEILSGRGSALFLAFEPILIGMVIARMKGSSDRPVAMAAVLVLAATSFLYNVMVLGTINLDKVID